jgi:hypothetical protein
VIGGNGAQNLATTAIDQHVGETASDKMQHQYFDYTA